MKNKILNPNFMLKTLIKNKSEQEYWLIVIEQLVEICGLTRFKAENEVCRWINQLKEIKCLKLNYHSNMYEQTFLLSGIKDEKPVGTCAYTETTEGKWRANNSVKLDEIERRFGW